MMLVAALAALAAPQAASAPPPNALSTAPAPFNAASAAETVEALAKSLEDNFVFPDVGKTYANALRAKLAAGGYSSFADASAFAATVTADLQAIHRDGHLRLVPPGPGAGRQPPATGDQPSGRPPGAQPKMVPIDKEGWIADGIAYVRFSAFFGEPETLARLAAFLETHKSATALIIDARGHRGGGLDEMDVIFPRIYSEPTTLVHMDTRIAVEERDGGVFEDGPTMLRMDGPPGVVRRAHVVKPGAETPLRHAKVFLLTSGLTASAAEHLALALKRTHRATLIGATTRGAGHFGSDVSLPGGFNAFVPVGRTFDPETGEGWEGSGVAPDVAVAPERALIEALTRSGITEADAQRLAQPYDADAPWQRARPR